MFVEKSALAMVLRQVYSSSSFFGISQLTVWRLKSVVSAATVNTIYVS
jgi:hypothetical protein